MNFGGEVFDLGARGGKKRGENAEPVNGNVVQSNVFVMSTKLQ